MSDFDNIRTELQRAQALNKYDPAAINKIPDSVDSLTLRDVAVIAKLGYKDLASAASFGNATGKHPELKGVIKEIQDLAVPMGAKGIKAVNGQPAPTAYDGLMRSIGDRFRQKPDLFDQLSADFKENPAAKARFMQAVKQDPKAMATAIRSYTGAEGAGSKTNGQLEKAIDSVLQSKPAPSKTTPKSEAGAPTPIASAPRPQKVESAADKPSPVAVTVRTNETPDAAKSTPSAPVVATQTADSGEIIDAGPAGANFALKAEDIGKKGGMADQLADRLLKTFPDMGTDIEGFRTKLKTDKALQKSIAENMNNNPEFVAQLAQFSNEGEDNKSDELLKKYGRDGIKDLLNHPDKLAKDDYVDGLSSQLKMANGSGFDIKGIISKLGDMLGIDLNALLAPIAELCQKGIAACQEFFGSGKAMSMASNIGDSVRSLSVDAADAIQNATGKKSDLEITTRYDRDGKEIQPVNENKTPAPEQNVRMAQVGQTVQNLQHQAPVNGPSGGAAAAAGLGAPS